MSTPANTLPLDPNFPEIRRQTIENFRNIMTEQELQDEVTHDRSFSDGYDQGYVDGYKAAVADIVAGRAPKHVPIQ